MLNIVIASLAVLCVGQPGQAGGGHGAPAAAAAAPLDWKTLEAPLLTEHVQLTTRDKFVKAGEAYFDHQSPPRWVVFQAVPVPEAGKEPDGFYGMYVAKLKYDEGRIVGIEEAVRISPEGSANTCGWFDPINPNTVIFGSTVMEPGVKERPGFRVGTNKYVWQFPPEMDIMEKCVGAMYIDAHGISGKQIDFRFLRIIERPNYDAECSYSKDGRFILYAHVRDEATRGKDDADIWIFDLKTQKHHEIVKADGYDGGPFFSPDGKRICYRSDREGNDKLQLFVSDLKFDADGVPVGIEREHPVTANEHVNWAPFWHPSGKFLVYGTSAMGHSNYEVFAVEAPEARDGAKKAGELRSRRITSANGADVLPVFSDDGQWMMWTAQRGEMVEGESKPSSQVWVARFSLPEQNTLWGGVDLMFLPKFDPPQTEADAITIAKKAIAINETWKESAEYRATKQDRGGWDVLVTRLPATPGGHRSITIEPDGTVSGYDRGH